MAAGMTWLFLCLATTACVASEPNHTEWKQAKEDLAAKEAAAAARQAKMAGVDKVSALLEDLKAKVVLEGEDEAASYNKFACFCKDTTNEKVKGIEKGSGVQSDISAAIGKLNSERKGCDKKIDDCNDALNKKEAEKAAEKDSRRKEADTYESEAAGLASAILNLEDAIEALKNSRPSLLQLQKVVKLLGARGASLERLIQKPDVPMQNYNYKSDAVTATLEKLLKDFRSKKQEIDIAEAEALSAHRLLMQGFADTVKKENHELDTQEKKKAQTQVEITENSKTLTTIVSTLLQDQKDLKELSDMCSKKAKTYDKRLVVRLNELSALAQAATIIRQKVVEKTTAGTIRFAQQHVRIDRAKAPSNRDVFEAAEAEAEAVEAAPPAFIATTVRRHAHRAASPDEGRQAVITLLRSKGSQLQSTLLQSLASQLAADPFAKIKLLIQELIERLLHEQGKEANQKGWCDKEIGDAEQQRDYRARDIEAANSELASLEARIDGLKEKIGDLKEEISALLKEENTQIDLRKAETNENADTVKEAKGGLEAVKQAKKVLQEFYRSNDGIGADASNSSFFQSPVEDAPDTGFDSGERYMGAQGESKGIIGILTVIESDFERTIIETKNAETQAARDHIAFMEESGKSTAQKNEAETQYKSEQRAAEDEQLAAGGELDDAVELLSKKIEALISLKAECIDTGMKYEDRVANREQEIAALKRAMCILKAYAEYGPDSSSDC